LEWWIFALVSVGMLVLLSAVLVHHLLYSGRSYGWLPLTPEQERLLQGMYERRRALRPQTRSVGAALFSRSSTSQNRVRVYPNGIKGWWLLGRHARYRFVPFEEITAIVPLLLLNPLAGKDSLFADLPLYQGLQVETSSGLVLLLQRGDVTIPDDVPLIARALRGAMGPLWAQRYQPDRPVWMRHLETARDTAWIHTAVRGSTTTTLVGPVRDLLADPRIPAVTRPGALWLEEGPDELARRREAYRLGGRKLLYAGLLAPVGGGLITLARGAPALVGAGMMLVVMGGLIGALGAYLMTASRRFRPLRIYENGLEGTTYGGEIFLLPYGDVRHVDEPPSLLLNLDHYAFTPENSSFLVAVPKALRGLDGLLPRIRERVGRGDYSGGSAPPIPFPRRREVLLHALMVVGTLAFVAFFAWFLTREDLAAFPVTFAWMIPPLGIDAVALVPLVITGTYRDLRGNLRYTPRFGLTTVLIASFWAFQLLLILVDWPRDPSSPDYRELLLGGSLCLGLTAIATLTAIPLLMRARAASH